jgi:hypothetical protein
MMTEERTRFEVLLENIQSNVQVIAEGHGALVERLDRMELKFECRFDQFERRFDQLDVRVQGLEGFASDAQQRLQRIETHLELNGSSHASPPKRATRDAAPKRRKKP